MHNTDIQPVKIVHWPHISSTAGLFWNEHWSLLWQITDNGTVFSSSGGLIVYVCSCSGRADNAILTCFTDTNAPAALLIHGKGVQSAYWCLVGAGFHLNVCSLFLLEWWVVGVVICLVRSRCRLFAYGLYGLADVCNPKPRHLLPHLNPDWFYLSGTGLPRWSWKRGR